MKKILDACCGPRLFWFDKKNKDTLYIDCRKEDPGFIDTRPNRAVQPDIIMDFRKIAYPDNSFYLIVWDPPHLNTLTDTSIMAKTYGTLRDLDWRAILADGFTEIWRVLKPNGTLIFKWSEHEIPVNEVLSLFSQRPLFGHPVGSKNKTHWVTFFKSESVR